MDTDCEKNSNNHCNQCAEYPWCNNSLLVIIIVGDISNEGQIDKNIYAETTNTDSINRVPGSEEIDMRLFLCHPANDSTNRRNYHKNTK